MSIAGVAGPTPRWRAREITEPVRDPASWLQFHHSARVF